MKKPKKDLEFVRFGYFEFCFRKVYKVYIIAKSVKTDIIIMLK